MAVAVGTVAALRAAPPKSLTSENVVRGPLKGSPYNMAVAVGFEPTVEFPPHALSRRAPLAARTRHRGREYRPAAGPG